MLQIVEHSFKDTHFTRYSELYVPSLQKCDISWKHSGILPCTSTPNTRVWALKKLENHVLFPSNSTGLLPMYNMEHTLHMTESNDFRLHYCDDICAGGGVFFIEITFMERPESIFKQFNLEMPGKHGRDSRDQDEHS